MKKGTILFNGSGDNGNTYFLAIDEKNIVWVYRNFKGDTTRVGRVPSGWRLEDVKYSLKLAIDFGQNWYVFPTVEAWNELLSL